MKPDLRFPATSRLRTSKEFARVWKAGTRHHTAHFIVIVSPGPAHGPRLGITVSRKVGNAVCRNRLKRWIRELFRCRRGGLDPAADISVIAKRTAGVLAHAEVDRQLLGVLSRLELRDHA